MKRFTLVSCASVIVALCLAAALRGGPKTAGPTAVTGNPATRPMGKLVVHEWGTFTGFAGSDGVHLPFNTVIGSDLPPFVMNRLKHAAGTDPKLAGLAQLVFAKAGGAAALQRMETPVMYFYADAPGDVLVRVDFPGGLLTEFFPPVRSIGPRYGTAYGELSISKQTPPAALPKTAPSATEPGTDSFLDWGRVRIVPHPSGNDGKVMPAVATTSQYRFARETDSALIQFADAHGEKHQEKFLFYRGLGNFKLPVTITARGADRFELHNAGTSPVACAFLIQVNADGRTQSRFARFDNLTGDQQLTLPQPSPAQDNLAEAITSSLVGSGLYEKEARAMVATWKSSWLNEPGTRVLYIVPRQVTDALLPLTVAPEPDETVRVLVGRIDVLTPEQEARLRSMMMAAGANTILSEDDVRMLKALGRFLVPALERVSQLAGDSAHQQLEYLQEALWRSGANRK